MTAELTRAGCLVCADTGHEGRLEGLLRQCRVCGFAWTAGGAAADVPDTELYDAGYFGGDDGDGRGYEDYFQPGARRYEARRRLTWLRRHGPFDSLVEVGCAGGFFVEAAERAGVSAHGFDVAARAVRYARDGLGVSVTLGAFESAPVAATVDLVCGFHVLEHVPDPHQTLRAARRHLAPGGLLALEVPDYGSPAAHRLGTDWSGLQPAYHRWHFGAESLVRLVSRHGFEVLSCDTAVFRFYMPRAYRRRHPRMAAADLVTTGSLRLVQRHGGDLLRLVARRRVA